MHTFSVKTRTFFKQRTDRQTSWGDYPKTESETKVIASGLKHDQSTHTSLKTERTLSLIIPCKTRVHFQNVESNNKNTHSYYSII